MNSRVDENIRYIAIANLLERKILVDYMPPSKKEKKSTFTNATKDIIEKLILISITSEERHTETITNDMKIVTVVDKTVKWCFIAIIYNEFPERLAYSMLNELQTKNLKVLMTKIFDAMDKSTIKSEIDNIQLYMVELYRRYNTPSQVDKLWGIKNDVDDIKSNLNKNVNLMVGNLTELSALQDKSQGIKDMAETFKNNSKSLKKQTRWQNTKVKIAVGTMGLGGIGFLVWKFFF